MARVPSSPARRTYQTGGTLPALTTEFRPIPLGRDSVGDVDAQVRALAVNIRNRADSPVYIREGADTPDSAEISRGEEYKIWEPSGVANLLMKGTNGGETVEVRVLEAHNDFDLTDKIDAFARSLAHFIGTATSNTNISGQDVDLSIDDAGGINVAGNVDVDNIADTVTIDDIQAGTVDIGDINGQSLNLDANGNVVVGNIQSGEVDIGTFADTVTIDDIQSGTVDVGNFADTVTIDDIQAGSVDVTGSTIDVGTFGDTVTVDDITAATANFDTTITGSNITLPTSIDAAAVTLDTNLTGSTVTQDIDVTAQSGAFDMRTFDRQGFDLRRQLSENGAAISENNPVDGTSIWAINDWTLFDPATEAGEVTALRYSIFNPNADAEGEIKYYGPMVQIDRGDTGSWEYVQSEWTGTPRHIANTAHEGAGNAELGYYIPGQRVDTIVRFPEGIKYEAGDSVRVRFNGRGPSPSTDNYSAYIRAEVTLRERPKD